MKAEQIAQPAHIDIVDGDARWYPAVQAVCDERFGTGYISRGVFDLWMQEKRLLKIALIHGDFAGFAVMIPAAAADVMKHMGMPEADVLSIAGDRPMLIYKSAAVCEAYGHRGVMKAMAAAGLAEAKALGYGSLFGSAWLYEGQMPIEKTFRVFGFVPLYRRHMLWYDDPDYKCAVCKGRCTCDAMIYYKKL